MSTEEQRYSFANQRRAISTYAEINGFEVVATYEDAAKSGVVITSRKGLTKLLQDVLARSVPFKAILVYDVSRWGRFQDTDEAAHYEFLCKRSGVPVHYCAEQFDNDGTMSSSIMKALKRSMAGEYSRELGLKVYEAKRRLAELGRRMGGRPGYGLRRAAMTADGHLRKTLDEGERRAYSTDHIELVGGPSEEVAWVRKMYSAFLQADGRLCPTDIARGLNHACVPYLDGRPWSQQSVRRILSSPKYTGCAVWGRTSQKLGGDRIFVDQGFWISKPGAFESVVSEQDFAKAHEILERQKNKKIPTEKLIAAARRLLKTHGRLTMTLLSGANGAPSNSTMLRRFGSLKTLYSMVGYQPRAGVFEVREHGIETDRLRNDLISKLLRMFPKDLAAFRLPNAARRSSLLLDGKFRIYVWLCQPFKNQSRSGWYLQTVPHENNGVTLICTVADGKKAFDSFHVFPAINVGRLQYSFDYDDEWLHSGVKLQDLSELCDVARHITLEYAIPLRPNQGTLRAPRVNSHKSGQSASHSGLNRRVGEVMRAGQRPVQTENVGRIVTRPSVRDGSDVSRTAQNEGVPWARRISERKVRWTADRVHKGARNR